MRVMACGAIPTSSSAASNARRLSPVCMPVSTSVHVAPARTSQTLTMVGRIGSGRNTSTTPGATSRVLPPSCFDLFVYAVLHGERDLHLHAPGAHFTVLDQRRDVHDVGLPYALDGGAGAVDGHADGLLDGAGRRRGELDRLLDHGAPPARHIAVDRDGDARYRPRGEQEGGDGRDG